MAFGVVPEVRRRTWSSAPYVASGAVEYDAVHGVRRRTWRSASYLKFGAVPGVRRRTWRPVPYLMSGAVPGVRCRTWRPAPYMASGESLVHMIGVWIVVVITVDRYVAICLPSELQLRTVRRAKAAVAGVILASAVFCLPLFTTASLSTALLQMNLGELWLSFSTRLRREPSTTSSRSASCHPTVTKHCLPLFATTSLSTLSTAVLQVNLG